MLDISSLNGIGFVLIAIGVVLAFVAMILLVFRPNRGPGQGRGVGVLLIGPIPIVFGTDKQSVRAVIVLAIILMLVVLAIMLVPLLLGH